MVRILNITNGDSASELMAIAGIPGQHLPWRDVLHEGPVHAGLSLDAQSEIRARYLASLGWDDEARALEDFRTRDDLLGRAREFDRIVLWFEHDLYDQLQILQILDHFAASPSVLPLHMICTEQYLGYCNAEQLAQLVRYEQAVSADQLTLASRAWNALGQDHPGHWNALLREDTSALPFLAGAVRRLLQELPAIDSGLSRTARSAMEIIALQPLSPGRLFGKQQETEERIFMGDLSFWRVLNELLCAPMALLALPGGVKTFDPRNGDDLLSLTREGERALSGDLNWMDHHQPDRWIGGTHLHADNLWFWDESSSLAIYNREPQLSTAEQRSSEHGSDV